jgi:hypothetical protein
MDEQATYEVELRGNDGSTVAILKRRWPFATVIEHRRRLYRSAGHMNDDGQWVYWLEHDYSYHPLVRAVGRRIKRLASRFRSSN